MLSFWKSQVNNNLLFSSLVKHLTPRQWKQRLSVTNTHMSDIQPHNRPVPSHWLISLCFLCSHSALIEITRESVQSKIAVSVMILDFRLIIMKHSETMWPFLKLHDTSPYLFSLSLWTMLWRWWAGWENMFVGKVHSFEQRAADIKWVKQSSLLSFEHHLNANTCKLSPTSHGFEI